MKPLLWAWIVCAIPGCLPSRILEIEQRVAALAAANDTLEKLEIKPAEEAVERLQAEIAELDRWGAATTLQLRQLRENLVELWQGDRASLEAKSRDAKLPGELMPFLVAAQESLGNMTKEQLFLHVMKTGDPKSLGMILDRWEAGAGFVSEADKVPAAAGCRRPKLETSCRELASEERPPVRRFLCAKRDASPKERATLISVETGQLVIRDFFVPDPEVKSVVRAFPEGWLVRMEFAEPVAKFPDEEAVKIPSRSFYAFYRLSNGRFRPELHLPIPEPGSRPILADLNGDGTDEVVDLTDPPAAYHYTMNEGDMLAWSSKEFCGLSGSPEVPALREICATRSSP
jgi:hypothetical protein